MARLGTSGGNAALNGLDGTGTTNVIGFGSLHTADPGTTGASEMASVTRQASVFAAASGSNKANTSAEAYTTPGTSAATFFGQWSASTAGNFGIGGALGSSVTATSITMAAGSKNLASS